jgi:hypothetical protein
LEKGRDWPNRDVTITLEANGAPLELVMPEREAEAMIKKLHAIGVALAGLSDRNKLG